MKNLFLFTLLPACLVSFLTVATPASAAEDALVHLMVSHGGMAGSEQVEIRKKKDRVVFSLIRHSRSGSLNYERDVPEDVLAAFGELARTHDIRAWKGFTESKMARTILDGEMFALEARWASGDSLSIHAYIERPNGYATFRKELQALRDETVRRYPPLNGREAGTKDR